MTTFGEWLKAARCKAGLTQAEIAGRLGIMQSVYSRLERREWSTPPMMARVAAALGVSFTARFGADGTVAYGRARK